jgi:hypothetical protein
MQLRGPGAALVSYTTNRAGPTVTGAGRGYIRGMTEKHIFADVSLPFHVWVKENQRWVLRDAASRLEDEASSRVAPATAPDRPQHPMPRR